MSLQLRPVVLADFDIMISHGTTYSPGDDLCAPPTPLCWPVSTPQAAQQRLQFHMSKQRARFLADPTAHFLKIVSIPESSSSDPSSQEQGEIISIAKWHYYPQGFHAFSTAPENDTPDISGLYELGNGSYVTKQGEVAWPADMNVQLHNYILTARDSARATWQLPNTPCWILTHLVTRSSHRGRGAASLLISWGIDKARTEGVPAYLEASAQGKPVYERAGFRQIGESMLVDLRPVGVEAEFSMVLMGILPPE